MSRPAAFTLLPNLDSRIIDMIACHKVNPRSLDVREAEGKRPKGSIDVLNEKIFMPSSYINYFVFAEWNLQTETLAIYFEKDLQSQLIKKISFAINE